MGLAPLNPAKVNKLVRLVQLFFLLSVCCVSYAENQADAAQKLRAILTDMSTLDAEFIQIVYSPEGDRLHETSGQLHASRPGQVRWETAPPMEQLLVSDGTTLWLFDPDLEQVTIRSFSDDLAKTPAVLFVGDLAALEQTYRVSVTSDQLTVFTLIPLTDDNLYEKLTLSFDRKKPTGMKLWDGLGQRTEIEFSSTEINRPISPALFTFIPPEGVDILRDE